jgi:hypothetical protein
VRIATRKEIEIEKIDLEKENGLRRRRIPLCKLFLISSSISLSGGFLWKESVAVTHFRLSVIDEVPISERRYTTRDDITL